VPGASRATRSVLICTTPRSGSTLLCRYLAGTGRVGAPQEYFLEAALPGLYAKRGVSDFPGYFEALLSGEVTPNGVFGAKLMGAPDVFAGYLARLRELPGLGDPQRPAAELLAAAFPGVRYVWLTRRDRLRQAISLERAALSGVWQSTQAAGAPPAEPPAEPDLARIDDWITDLVAWDAAWERTFADAGVRPVTVVYEDLVRSPGAAVRELLAALEIDLPADWKPGPPERERLSDSTSDRWLEAYRREAKRARSGARRRAAGVAAGEYLRPEGAPARLLARAPTPQLLKALLLRVAGGLRRLTGHSPDPPAKSS
jgi:LPS sulfotransferase NodH